MKKIEVLILPLVFLLLFSGCAWYGVGPDGEPYLYSPWGWPYYSTWPAGGSGSYPSYATWGYGRTGYYGYSGIRNPGAPPSSPPDGYYWQYGVNGWALYPVAP